MEFWDVEVHRRGGETISTVIMEELSNISEIKSYKTHFYRILIYTITLRNFVVPTRSVWQVILFWENGCGSPNHI